MVNIERSTIPLRLTQQRRKHVAALLPRLAGRLRPDESVSCVIHFTFEELREVAAKCNATVPEETKRQAKQALQRVAEAALQALQSYGAKGLGQIPASERIFQFKITLLQIHPPIWRRIQVKDCTLDRLHQHIQRSMGWRNVHLHHFTLNGLIYGDPQLMYERWELRLVTTTAKRWNRCFMVGCLQTGHRPIGAAA